MKQSPLTDEESKDLAEACTQAGLLSLGLPPLHVTERRVDRTIGTDPTGRIESWCRAEQRAHRLTLDDPATAKRNHGPTAYLSVRQKFAGGMQLVFHQADRRRWIEIDGDLSQPIRENLWSLIKHSSEFIRNWWTKSKTDQRKRAALMEARGIVTDPQIVAEAVRVYREDGPMAV